MCALAGVQKFVFFVFKKIAIIIEADRGFFHDHRSRGHVIEHSPIHKEGQETCTRIIS